MDVLIVRSDLYSGQTVGGGETFYRKLIEAHPEIRFHYPSTNAQAERPPANAHPTQIDTRVSQDPAFAGPAAFAGRQFDVIDVPDFYRWALNFLGACEHFGVKATTIALSLHGRLTQNWRLQWDPPDANFLAHEAAKEHLLYRYADVRYGISRAYIDELAAAEGRRALFLNPIPLYGVTDLKPVEAPGDKPPALLFVGRSDRRKGPDLFVDVVSNIPPELFSEAVMVGPHPNDAAARLTVMAFRRGIDLRFAGSLSHDQVMQLYASRALSLVTSRYETLSLTALEGLLSGCPTAIAPHLGAVRALDEDFPGIPYLRIPIEEPVASAAAIADVLRHYDEHRCRLVAYLTGRQPRFEGCRLTNIYGAPHDHDADVRAQVRSAVAPLLAALPPAIGGQPAPAVAPATPDKTPTGLVGASTPPLQTRFSSDQTREMFRNWSNEVRQCLALYDQYVRMPETTSGQLDAKWQFLSAVGSGVRHDRVRRTRELARLERLRGRPLVAAAYELRVMRWLGEDRFDALPGVVDSLTAGNYREEAKAARLMFGRDAGGDAAILDYLHSRDRLYREPPVPDFERLLDGRDGDGYRVSVIVSLYNTGSKLPRFLRALTTQTMFRQGRMEIILVDSASPRDESDALTATLGERPRHLLYLRTRQRETIQYAWNRGIGLARAPCLLFLGVDEEIRPDAAELLADQLDRHPEIDWVQSGTVIFDVDKAGVFDHDTGGNDRKWAAADAQYLDTTYLGHVAGLYRKSLHDRVGLYDPEFRGAGDTEFKNRVVPRLRAKTLPIILGRYVNYPEERTTASCGAELEDLRAWYLHRTPGGIRYAFDHRDPRDLENLLSAALQHHKCYRTGISSDADLAVLAADLLADRDPASAMLQYRAGSHGLQQVWRRLDFVMGDWPIERSDCLGPELLSQEIGKIGETALRIARQHGRLRGLGIDDDYHFINDNRCEQHSWTWP